MVQRFKHFLDDSADAETIALELQENYEFEELAELCTDVDHKDEQVLQAKGLNVTVESMQQILFDFIRHVWDTAYSYGEHDALIGEGVSLAELVESEGC